MNPGAYCGSDLRSAILFCMVFKEIPLEEIDFANESYRNSEELDSMALADSLRAVGQLNPVCVVDASPHKIIACGFRRLTALRRLGMPRALARILPADSGGPVRLFNVALWDNLSHRQLNALEKSRGIRLRYNCVVGNRGLCPR